MTKKKAAIARQKSYATARKASIKAALSEKYLTVKEAAEWLKMTESHIYALKRTKKIPHVKLGGKLLFEKESLKEWVESNSSAAIPFVRKSRKWYDISTGHIVKAPATEKMVQHLSKPMSNKEVVEMLEQLQTPDLNTVLDLGHLNIQIVRSGKEVNVIPKMQGDPIDLSAGICSLMLRTPEYRKIFETAVFMYQKFVKP